MRPSSEGISVNFGSMNDLPAELALLIFDFLPETVDKLRLAQTCKVFAAIARLPSAWKSLELKSVGVTLSGRTRRRVAPSPVFFLESLYAFLSNPRFFAVSRIDASLRYLGEPAMFISTLILPCCPNVEILDLTECEPDFSWSFLRLRSIPNDQSIELLKLPLLTSIIYGKHVWTVKTALKGRILCRN